MPENNPLGHSTRDQINFHQVSLFFRLSPPAFTSNFLADFNLLPLLPTCC